MKKKKAHLFVFLTGILLCAILIITRTKEHYYYINEVDLYVKTVSCWHKKYGYVFFGKSKSKLFKNKKCDFTVILKTDTPVFFFDPNSKRTIYYSNIYSDVTINMCDNIYEFIDATKIKDSVFLEERIKSQSRNVKEPYIIVTLGLMPGCGFKKKAGETYFTRIPFLE